MLSKEDKTGWVAQGADPLCRNRKMLSVFDNGFLAAEARFTKRTHLTRSVTPDRACPGLDPGIRGPDGSVARDWASYKICNSEAQLQISLMCL